jgi:hypothetical protein
MECMRSFDPMLGLILTECKAMHCDGCDQRICGFCFKVNFLDGTHDHLVNCTENPTNMSMSRQVAVYNILMKDAVERPDPTTGGYQEWEGVADPGSIYTQNVTINQRIVQLAAKQTFAEGWETMCRSSNASDRGWLCDNMAETDSIATLIKECGFRLGEKVETTGFRCLNNIPYIYPVCYGTRPAGMATAVDMGMDLVDDAVDIRLE